MVPGKDWLLANKFPIIASVINRSAGNYGYGDYTQVPAVSYYPAFTSPAAMLTLLTALLLTILRTRYCWKLHWRHPTLQNR